MNFWSSRSRAEQPTMETEEKTKTTTQQRRKTRKDLEMEVLDKVGEVFSSINEAKHVDQVICALRSLALLLFPPDSSLLTGCIDISDKDQVPLASESKELRNAFYQGSAFPTLAKFLIYDVASNWLACFPFSARSCVYDSFFVNGPSAEVVQAVIPGLLESSSKTEDIDFNAVCSNTERLLILCLLENNGVLQMAREFGNSDRIEEDVSGKVNPDRLNFISRIAQQVASIPDKARRNSPAALSSHLFFKQIGIQLLEGIEGNTPQICGTFVPTDCTFVFVGEVFTRICRRGSADILVHEIIPRILELVRSYLSSNVDFVGPNMIETNTRAFFWTNLMEAMKDPYAVEKMSEQLLHSLGSEKTSDKEAYWTLWILFHRTLKQHGSIKSMFVDKFLLWKVFPIRCLRWILQFAVLECRPFASGLTKGENTRGLLDRVQCIVRVWSKLEFVQRASMEQQAYVTAALGLLLEAMSKDELETTKDVMPLILQGVSCRLESPIHLVRKMASCIALAFSKVVDPKNPLYLDDSCNEETIDWELGFAKEDGRSLDASNSIKAKDKEETPSICVRNKHIDSAANGSSQYSASNRNKNLSDYKLIDPDEIVDPATLHNDYIDEEDADDNASENSDTLSDSSLQPYDLSDDDMDLKRKFSQLIDIVGALRKPDDPDGVERALDVAEDFIRASPDELQHVSGELIRALVQVRCSDLTVEGEEESVEVKRQKAMTALLATHPFESLEALNRLLYSPNVDISQRILILDTMTDAAQELAATKSMRVKHHQRGLISTISDPHPWFLPSNRGAPGATPWKEVSESGTPLSWSYRYERELPLKSNQFKTGKSRRWSLQSAGTQDKQIEWSKNKFPVYAAAFMLPAMEGFDKKRHGVDLLGGDFIVLGKLIYMLGTCMKCTALHPEASVLAPPLLDMLSSRAVSHHAEAYVRRSVAFAASCVLTALHPSFVASALVEGNSEISQGLEWIRTWSIQVAESDTDTECSTDTMADLLLDAIIVKGRSILYQLIRALGKKNGAVLQPKDNIAKKVFLCLKKQIPLAFRISN